MGDNTPSNKLIAHILSFDSKIIIHDAFIK